MKTLAQTEGRRPRSIVAPRRAPSAEPVLCHPEKAKHDGALRDVTQSSFTRARSAGEAKEQESTKRANSRLSTKHKQKTKPVSDEELEALLEDDSEDAERFEAVVSFR